MGSILVLMYHALHADEAERRAIDAADRPYAVSTAAFRAHLDAMRSAGIPILDPEAAAADAGFARGGVVLTFDDGHASAWRHAWPILREHGATALFFVTTGFIGARPGFCSWPQLHEMARGGMRIGAHGRTHRFFEDLGEAEADEEFRASRAAIAAGTGTSPRMMSFPGGRYRPEQIAQGRAAGFTHFFTSEAGANTPSRYAGGGPIRRIAVRAETPAGTLRRLARGERLALWRAAAVSRAKRGAQRMVGNRVYHALYERLARR